MSDLTEREMLIHELSKFDNRTLATALAYAQNLELFDIDITEKWQTAVKQKKVLTALWQRFCAGDITDPPPFDEVPDDTVVGFPFTMEE